MENLTFGFALIFKHINFDLFYYDHYSFAMHVKRFYFKVKCVLMQYYSSNLYNCALGVLKWKVQGAQ